jgi:hypothetical protein
MATQRQAAGLNWKMSLQCQNFNSLVCWKEKSRPYAPHLKKHAENDGWLSVLSYVASVLEVLKDDSLRTGEQACSSVSCSTDVIQKLNAHVQSPYQVPNTLRAEMFAALQVITKLLHLLQKRFPQLFAFSEYPRKVYRGCKTL